jgi:hypothetical protein
MAVLIRRRFSRRACPPRQSPLLHGGQARRLNIFSILTIKNYSAPGGRGMNAIYLPPELESLECLLADAPQPEPPDALRRRILDGVQTQLRRDRTVRRWRVAAASAAAVLVVIGLSLGALGATSFAFQPREPSPSIYEVARRLQQLSPGLSREESLRQAVLRQIGNSASSQTPLGEIPPEPQRDDS